MSKNKVLVSESGENRILIIDDSITMYKIISKNLCSNGIIFVDYAPDGISGTRIASAKDYDLITVDVDMPGIDGFKTVEEIQKIKPYQKFLFISSQSHDENKARAKEMGVQYFLGKPFTPEYLIEFVLNALKYEKIGS